MQNLFELGMRATGLAQFGRMKVRGPVVFRTYLSRSATEPATFTEADFSGSDFQSSANFEGVRTTGPFRIRDAHIAGTATFRYLNCGGDFDATRLQIGGDAYFDFEVKFAGPAVFVGAIFEKQLVMNGASFAAAAVFDGSSVQHAAVFQQTRFAAEVSLRDARFSILNLGEGAGAVVFNDGADRWELGGLTYTRITADWKQLVKRIPRDTVQPYVELERAFRSAGDDRIGDSIFVARRIEEKRMLRRGIWRHLKKLSLGSALRDCPKWMEQSIVHWIFNFGVPAYRMLAVAAILFALGVLLLSVPGALETVKTGQGSGPQRLATLASNQERIAVGAITFMGILQVPAASVPVIVIPVETTAQAIAQLDEQFPWLRTAKRSADTRR